ncbi:MAG: DUF2779 domain-containing protein [Bdellovibrio sp.]
MRPLPKLLSKAKIMRGYHCLKNIYLTVHHPDLEACGEKGSIVAYYSQFESSRISEMADYSIEYSKKIKSLLDSIVDPLPLIRDTVYDNEFGCSFSLKAVAPAIWGGSQSYDRMLVANGTAAQRAFEEIINGETPTDRKHELIQASLEYCKKDTLVMVELVKWLFQEVGLVSMETT